MADISSKQQKYINVLLNMPHFYLMLSKSHVYVEHQLMVGNKAGCSLRQLTGASCGKHLEMYCHILSGCCANFTL